MYYNGRMRKERANIGFSVRTPLEGFGIVLLSVASFLVFLWFLIIVVRVVAG